MSRKPKLGQRNGAPAWVHDGHALSTPARAALTTALGYSEEDGTFPDALRQALEEVSGILGAYPGAVQALDNAPRSRDFQVEFHRLGRAANALQKRLQELSAFHRKELGVLHANFTYARLRALAWELEWLEDTCAMGCRKHAGRHRHGKPRHEALRLIIGKLRAIFYKYHVNPRVERTHRGFVFERALWEKGEAKFVEVALKDAKIGVQGLASKLRDPGFRLIGELVQKD